MKHLNAYKRAAEKVKGFSIPGARLLVERLPKEEAKTKGGIILARKDNQKLSFATMESLEVVVLAVGEDCEVDLQPGNVCIISPNSATFYSSLGKAAITDVNTIGMIGEHSVQMVFKDKEAYDEFFEEVNK